MLKELANRYGVSTKTFVKWLQCKTLSHICNDKIGYYYSIKQIREIVEHLGEPLEIEDI